MKRLIAAVAAVSTLAGPTLALAQDHEHEQAGNRSGGRQGGSAPQAVAPPQYRAAPQPQPQPQSQPQPQAAPRGGWQGGGSRGQGSYQPQTQPQAQPQPQPQARQWQGGSGQGRQGYQQPQVQQPQAQPTYRGGHQNDWRGQNAYQGQYRNGYQDHNASRGDYDRDHRNEGYRGGPRPGAQPFTWGGRSFYRYRSEPYRWGAYAGWAGHGWRRGEYLPSYFFLPNYYITDWWSYGLWEPDYGLEWIRVGRDALLIDLSTGEVVDVVPGVYYW